MLHAGVFATRKQQTEDGFELTWAVNVLAPFLLTALLYSSVKERIVNVSSISAGSKIDFDNLQGVRSNFFYCFKEVHVAQISHSAASVHFWVAIAGLLPRQTEGVRA